MKIGMKECMWNFLLPAVEVVYTVMFGIFLPSTAAPMVEWIPGSTDNMCLLIRNAVLHTLVF